MKGSTKARPLILLFKNKGLNRIDYNPTVTPTQLGWLNATSIKKW